MATSDRAPRRGAAGASSAPTGADAPRHPRAVEWRRVLLGRRRHRSLVLTHGIDDFADALVTLSLAGSLFFRVSLEASRTRILLYLLLTAVPLAAVAPLVGPLVERTRTGYRQLIVFSELGRVVLALALARELRSLALYPLAFGILLCRKVYSIPKTAIVAQLVDDERDLVTANAHLSRAGTIAAALGTALGAALLDGRCAVAAGGGRRASTSWPPSRPAASRRAAGGRRRTSWRRIRPWPSSPRCGWRRPRWR